MYICGKNVVKEYLKEKREVNKIYLYKNFNDKEIVKILPKNVQITYMEKYEMDKLVKENHQGIIIKVDDYKYATLNDVLTKENPLLVMLDHIEDPHNFGAIIRTCEAAGIDGIIIPKDRSVDVTSTVIKVSTGAISHMKIVQVTNLTKTIENLKKQGFWFIGMDMDGTNYTELDYSGKICLVVGSEGFGMKRLVKESCDFIASIPMYGQVNSLNASVATGIVIYGAINKRNVQL